MHVHVPKLFSLADQKNSIHKSRLSSVLMYSFKILKLKSCIFIEIILRFTFKHSVEITKTWYKNLVISNLNSNCNIHTLLYKKKNLKFFIFFLNFSRASKFLLINFYYRIYSPLPSSQPRDLLLLAKMSVSHPIYPDHFWATSATHAMDSLSRCLFPLLS